MTFIAFAAVFFLATPLFAQIYPVFSDSIYDLGDTPLSSTACSNGQYGLGSRGYNTFNDLPTYPYVGGAPQIQGWNSPSYGTCWQIQYTDPTGAINTFIDYTAIDEGSSNPPGFTVSAEALDFLTGGNARSLDGVSMNVFSQDQSFCVPSKSE